MNRIASALVGVGLLAVGLLLIGLMLSGLVLVAWHIAGSADAIWLRITTFGLLLTAITTLFVAAVWWLNRGATAEPATGNRLMRSLRDGGILAGLGGALAGVYLMLAAIQTRETRGLIAGAAVFLICVLFIRDWRTRW